MRKEINLSRIGNGSDEALNRIRNGEKYDVRIRAHQHCKRGSATSSVSSRFTDRCTVLETGFAFAKVIRGPVDERG